MSAATVMMRRPRLDVIGDLGDRRDQAVEDRQAAFARGAADRFDRRLDLRVLAIAEDAGRAGHVVRTDRHRVDAGHGEEIVEDGEWWRCSRSAA